MLFFMVGIIGRLGKLSIEHKFPSPCADLAGARRTERGNAPAKLLARACSQRAQPRLWRSSYLESARYALAAETKANRA